MFDISDVCVYNANCTSKMSFSKSKCAIIVQIFFNRIIAHLYLHGTCNVNDETFTLAQSIEQMFVTYQVTLTQIENFAMLVYPYLVWEFY